MSRGVFIFITAFFFLAGFIFGMLYKKLIQKKKIKQHVYTDVKEHKSRHFDDLDVIKDTPLQLRNVNSDLSCVDDGLEEHSEKKFIMPKDFENETESYTINNYSDEPSENIPENNNMKNLENEIESHFDGKPVKPLQTEEEQELLDKEMDANTVPVKEEIEKYIND